MNVRYAVSVLALLLAGCAEIKVGDGLFWALVVVVFAVVAIVLIIVFAGQPLKLNPRFERPPAPVPSREWAAKMSDFGDPPGGQRGGL